MQGIKPSPKTTTRLTTPPTTLTPHPPHAAHNHLHPLFLRLPPPMGIHALPRKRMRRHARSAGLRRRVLRNDKEGEY